MSSFERHALGFERQTGIHPEATDHSRKSDAKDVQIVVEVVLKARILEVIDKRCQSKFPTFSPNPLDRIERDTCTCCSPRLSIPDLHTHVHSNSIYNQYTHADFGEGGVTLY